MSTSERCASHFTDSVSFVFLRSPGRILGGTHLVRVTLLAHGDVDHPLAAFSLSSGTIGAALAGSVSGVRSIALSYGTMTENIPTTFHDPAFKLSSQIINRLLSKWGRPDLLYSVNIPMIKKLLHEDGLKVYWTSVWRNNYGRLFKEVTGLVENASGELENTLQLTDTNVPREGGGVNLVFKFEPDFTGLLNPTSAPEGSDGWALAQGAASVTPLLTSFAELPESEHGFPRLQDREWKFKL